MPDEPMPTELRHRLLVATPLLGDPNFERTVILILEHSDDGALGLVLNRTTGAPTDEIVPGFGRYAAEPDTIHRGGPVTPSAVIALARRTHPDTEVDGLTPVFGDIVAVDLDRDPDDYDGWIHSARLFAGYAGWSAGQLEGELDEQAWFVVDARPDDAFTPSPERQWREVLARQRTRVAVFAAFPDDPNTN